MKTAAKKIARDLVGEQQEYMPIIMQHLREKCADVSISPNRDLIYRMQSVVQ